MQKGNGKNLSYTIFIIFGLLCISNCQQCQQYDPLAAQASNDLCAPFLFDKIWSPYPLPIPVQSTVASSFNKSILYRIRPLIPVIPVSCLNSMLALMCNSVFQPCEDVYVPQLNATAPIAFPPCSSVCRAVNYECTAFFNHYNISKMDCEAESYYGKYPMFPETTVYTNFLGVSINTSCYAADKFPAPNYMWNVQTCPYPLNKATIPKDARPFQNRTASAPRCYTPCLKSYYWTDAEWALLGRITVVCASLSFCLMFLLSIHYLLDPSCRNITMRFQLYSFVCQMIFCLGLMLNGTDPINKAWCHDDTTRARIKDTTCGAQGLLMIYGGLSQAIWWAISSSCLYFRLETGVYKISKPQEILYHVAAFGIPAVFAIVAGALDSIVVLGTPMCFIGELIPGTNFAYQYPLFYIPFSIPMIIAMIFMSLTTWKLINHTITMKKTFKETEIHSNVSLFQINIRLLIWCFVLFLTFFTFLGYRAMTQSKQDFMYDDLVTWALCKIKYELGIGSDALCSTKHYPHPISFGGSVVHYIIVPSVGTFSFLVLGLNKHIFLFWKVFINLLIAQKFSEIRALISDKKALSKLGTPTTEARTSELNNINTSGSAKRNTSSGISGISGKDDTKSNDIGSLNVNDGAEDEAKSANNAAP